MEKQECAWEIEKGKCFMVAHIPWSRLGDFITREKKHMTDVQTRFLKRPNGTGPPKQSRHNIGLYNYRYTNVTAFLSKLCCLFKYCCVLMMLLTRTMQMLAMAPC
jgi:hypothetical protein